MKVLFITTALYPKESAMAHRVHLFAKSLQELGHDVFVLSNGKTGYLKIKQFDKVNYQSLKVDGTSLPIRYLGMKFYTSRLKKALGHLVKPDVIFASDLENDSLVFLKKYCQENHIPLVYDCVEWYSPEEFEDGEKNRGYQKKDYQNRVLLDDSVNIIAISKYLEDYFNEKGCHTLRIPVCCDAGIQEENREENDLISFVYAGSPGRKDNINVLMEALKQMPFQLFEKARFHFIGLSKEDVDCLPLLDKFCTFYGRKSYDETIEIVKKCDFSFLFRDADAVYAKAGFPTKSVESLNYGIPLICNYSSDLKDYLVDGQNAIIVDTVDAQNIAKSIENVLQLSRHEIALMQQHAKQTARTSFHYQNHLEELQVFLENVK